MIFFTSFIFYMWFIYFYDSFLFSCGLHELLYHLFTFKSFYYFSHRYLFLQIYRSFFTYDFSHMNNSFSQLFTYPSHVYQSSGYEMLKCTGDHFVRDGCLLLNRFSSNTLLIHLLSKTCRTLFFYERWWDGIWKTVVCVSLGRLMHKCMNTVGQGHENMMWIKIADWQILFTLSSSSALRLYSQCNHSHMENPRCNHLHWDHVRWHSVSAFAPPKQGSFTGQCIPVRNGELYCKCWITLYSRTYCWSVCRWLGSLAGCCDVWVVVALQEGDYAGDWCSLNSIFLCCVRSTFTQPVTLQHTVYE